MGGQVVEGMKFDRGYISPYFVTDPKTMTAELDDPFILIAEKKISSCASRNLVPEHADCICAKQSMRVNQAGGSMRKHAIKYNHLCIRADCNAYEVIGEPECS